MSFNNPSPSPMGSPIDDRSRPQTLLSPSSSRPRRPLTPSSLRDLDLSNPTDTSRKFPAPPTGHELMAMFPPAAPTSFSGRPEATSGFFQRQERAYFAQAGKEIVRFHVEVDVPGDRSSRVSKPHPHPGNSRGWSHSPTSSMSLAQSTPSPPFHPSSPGGHPYSPRYSQQIPGSTSARPRTSGPASSVPVFPQMPPHPAPGPSHLPPNLHSAPAGPGIHPSHDAPPHAAGSRTLHEPHSDEGRDSSDEAWRTPMPYAERRRAGKHTRRVIVRN